ncbi:MAG: L,D-transpeptidase [Myxococcales bacterium]|nr:L,D-transpeptidase [Myxococcales bacterium]
MIPNRRTLALGLALGQALACLAACSRETAPGDATHPAAPEAVAPTELGSPRAPEGTAPAPSMAFDVAQAEDGIEFVEVALQTAELEHFTEVRAAPSQGAVLLGVLAPAVRVDVHPPIPADDCVHGWRAIEPRGYICATTVATDRDPSRELFPRVPAGALVPGVYGKIRGEGARIFDDALAARTGRGRTPDAALTVRRLGTVRVDGREYWRTRHGLVAAADIRKLDSSTFRGLEVDDALEQPIAWARFRGDDGAIPLHTAPSERSAVQARWKARQTARVVETSADGKWVRLDRGGWAQRALVRIASRTAAPEGIAADERWLDIDIEQQTLVAYVGDRPVYATLVSTGRRTHDTPTGIFRIERKLAERTMSSRPDDDEPYAVDRVPWTAYFIGSFALHTAYWHGSFGERKSHGCINLAPRDARRLYGWTAPGVLPGYTEIIGSPEQPGAVIRIRSAEDPTPAWQGYAATMRGGDGPA